jgi:hypothetical protein
MILCSQPAMHQKKEKTLVSIARPHFAVLLNTVSNRQEPSLRQQNKVTVSKVLLT